MDMNKKSQYWFLFFKDKLLLKKGKDNQYAIPRPPSKVLLKSSSLRTYPLKRHPWMMTIRKTNNMRKSG